MAWQDRPYFRESGNTSGSPLMWLFNGRVPLFTVFGIRVQAHSTLVISIALGLLLGVGRGFGYRDRVEGMTALFFIVLLHEFGHCFTARWVGGEADEIVMHPLGGLALARPPHRPLPTFLTVAGGPAVNVLICIICGSILWSLFGWVPWNPFRFVPIHAAESWTQLWTYVYWIYQMSLMNLAFNLMPIYPLDGGQMLHSALWPWFGYYKSMNFACITGMVAAVLGAMIAVASLNFWLAVLALMGFIFCLNKRRELLAAGPYGMADETDYSAAYEPATPKKSRLGRWAMRRARNRAMKESRREREEQERLDAVLAKVSKHGMQSLSWIEKRALHKATERKRQGESRTRSR